VMHYTLLLQRVKYNGKVIDQTSHSHFKYTSADQSRLM
jgi:hypothetical protein